MSNPALNRVKGVARQVAFPYDVFEKDTNGRIEYDFADPERPPDPKVDVVSTWTARVLSVITALVTIDVALREAFDFGFADILDRLGL